MLTWVALGLLACAAGVAIRWVLGRTDELGRPRGFPTYSVVVLVVLGLGAAWPGYQRHQLESRLEQVASTLVGADVEVRCQTFGESFVDATAELGYVPFGEDGVPERRTLLKRDLCADLKSYIGSDHATPSQDEIVAVHVLTHEAMHMRGLTNEAETECAAMQRNALTARLLGADAEEAVALAQAYTRQLYPRVSPDYRTGECAPGQPLDEALPDPPW